MRRLYFIVRAIGIAWVYAITLGCVYAVRLFWMETAHKGYALRLHDAGIAVLYTSPFILLTGSMFSLLALPLAAWAIGSANWSVLSRYVFLFWFVLAFLIVISASPGSLIFVSGAGLIALWFIRHREGFVPVPFDMRREVKTFAALAAITGVLALWIFQKGETKIYLLEIVVVYFIACVCQGFVTFRQTEELPPSAL